MNKTPDIVFGDYTLRIREGNDCWRGIVVGHSSNQLVAATRAELIKMLENAALENHLEFLGFDGAVQRFLKLFPQGFEDLNFVGDSEFGEIRYKRQIVDKLQEALPLRDALTLPGNCETALKMFRSVNLIDPFTKTSIQNTLRSPDGPEFLDVCVAFANGDIKEACTVLNNKFEDYGVAKWPAITFLPFFWRPDAHMFLKPEFTKTFAERVGHRFVTEYQSKPSVSVYESLLDLADSTKDAVADVNGADKIDHIDVHSFMWTVVGYALSDVGTKDNV